MRTNTGTLCRESTAATWWSGAFLLFLLHLPGVLRAAESVHLDGKVPAVVSRLAPAGRLSGTNYLHLAIGLPLRNQAELNHLLAQIYDPRNTNYHHYLSPGEFTARFGPTDKDYESLRSFVTTQGLKVTRTHANRALLDVSGQASEIERIFHVHLQLYPHPKEARNFYAPDAEPALDVKVPILSVAGLDNYTLPKPMSLHRAAVALGKPLAGSGPGGAYLGNDLRTAYLPGCLLTGLGQQVGLFEMDGYYPNDISSYEALAGLPAVPITPVLLDGDGGAPGAANAECSLDIEMAISLAPGLSQVLVYEGTVADDILNQMAADDAASQLSSSWSFSTDPETEQIFQEFAAQGQSFFNASGDSDAYGTLPIPQPCDDTNITIVGGTALTTATNGAWLAEKVWNWEDGVGSGGGISAQYAIPPWQQGVNMSLNQGSTTMRNIPDVAFTADNIWVLYGDGTNGVFGGTSCAAPLWAAFTALINQQAVNNQEPAVGFLNPAVYALGQTNTYTTVFHDITSGDNTSPASPLLFFAVPGYDLCTGWGTPGGQSLIDALAGPALPTPPFIITQPLDETVESGSNCVFGVVAGGAPPLSYQWECSGTNLPGATNATLVLTNVQFAQSGSYAALVTNAFGYALSYEAQLTVLELPPTILTEPVDETVYAGYSASFSISASGSLPLSYQWMLDGTSLAGATNATLTLADAQADDAGDYSVLVTNAFGSELSYDATLTVNPPPSCEPAPAGLVSWWPGEGNANDNMGLNNGVAMGGLGYTNGEVGTAFVFDGSDSYITVPASASLDIGSTGSGITIECWIEPNAFDVNISGAPIIEWDSSDDDGLQFWSGGQLFGNVKDTSDNPHTLQSDPGLLDTNNWQHVALTYDESSGDAFIYLNGSVVAAQNLGSFEPLTSYPVNIGRRSGQVIGLGDTYGGLMDELAIYNRALGPDEIQAIYAAGIGGKCLLPPTIVTQPVSETVPLGGTNEFSVSAIGSPPLSYQWEFQGTNLPGATNATLIFTAVRLDQMGNYQALVTNAAGSALSAAALLTVNPPPPCSPAPAGLAAWWAGEGNANDNLGLGNGQVMGGLGYASGEVGSAFVFDNSTSYITVPASSNLDIGASGSGITIECWIQPNAFNVGVSGGPLVEWDSASTDGLQFWCDGDLYANVKDTEGNPHTLDTSPGLVDTNHWHHVALTYDKSSGNAWIYLDGNAVASQNFGSVIPQTSYPLNIGRRTGESIGRGDTYGGLMDELAIYNRALGPDEIEAIFAAGSSGKCPLPPEILSEPTNQTVLAGTTAGFGITASGSQPLGYQWLFQGTNLPGATNAALVLNDAQLSQSGNYAVLVSNTVGMAVSSNALLTVYGLPPAISVQPASQTVYIGETAVFGVSANGTAPLSYQWRLQGTNLTGATNASLVFPDVQTNLAGNYSVRITNAFGSVLSSNASLAVVSVPTCDAAPAGLVSWWPGEGNAADIAGTNAGVLTGGITFTNGEVGQAFVFNNSSSYISVPASPALDIKGGTGLTIECWMKPNAFNIISGSPIAEWDATNTDGLQLWCGGNLNANFKDTSGVAHTIVSASGVLHTNAFQHVAVTYAKSTGMAYLYLNGTQIAAQNIGNVTPQTTYPAYHLNIGRRTGQPIGLNDTYGGLLDELSIYNRALSQGEIQAIYAAGSAGKCPPLPVVVAQPANQVVLAGGTATFGVAAGGSLPLAYQWIFNGSNNLAGATNATLTLTNVQLANAGAYSVLITNSYGSALSANALLLVHLQNHFAWGAIPSPRFVNEPFTATIQAQNATNGTVTNFTGAVNLTSTLGIPILPAVSGAFVRGSWTGPVTVAQAVSNLVLRADDGLGDTGLASAINIVGRPVLGVAPTGNYLLMFWPAGLTGFVLESAPALNSTNWVQAGTPILIGNQYLESLPASGTNHFYRLRYTLP